MSIHLYEILIVNGIGMCMMAFLLLTRIKNSEFPKRGEKLFSAMVWITLAACPAEALTFIVDGVMFPGAIALSYLLNSFCFLGTCSVGYLWCLYVQLRIYRTHDNFKRKAWLLAIPLMADVILILINLFGNGIIFSISSDNVYSRGSMVSATYAFLFFYFIYSICQVQYAKHIGVQIRFFPILYFVMPCVAGTIIQGLMYGITLGWTSVAIAMLFTYIQIQSANSYVDHLSGLYNRRYLEYILKQIKISCKQKAVHGIMIDVNDFKKINDDFGHSKGDEAIKLIGNVLQDAVVDDGIAFRYAGDEFIVLIGIEKECSAKEIMRRIEEHLQMLSDTGKIPYVLSAAMGCSSYNVSEDDVEDFLSAMDHEMYIAKKRYYQQVNVDRRKKTDNNELPAKDIR